MTDKKKWLISFSLVYNSGLYINVSQPTEFSKLIYYTILSYVYETCLLATFDVQNGSLEVIDSTIGEVRFICHFVIGSQSQGCYIEYKCLKMDFNGNITIVRKLTETNATKCVNGIYTCDYNVTFYDVDYNNTIYEDDYAVKLTNQSVTGLSPIPSTIIPVLTTIPNQSVTALSSFPSTIIPILTTVTNQSVTDLSSIPFTILTTIHTSTPTSISGVFSSTNVISTSPSPTLHTDNSKLLY